MRLRFMLISGGESLVLAACLWGQTGQSVASIAVRAGRLYDGKSDRLLANQVVLIEGDKITEVGPSDRVKIPAGAVELDLTHSTVLPGLIDAHTHLFLTGESAGRHYGTPASEICNEGRAGVKERLDVKQRGESVSSEQ